MARWAGFHFELRATIGDFSFPHVVQYAGTFGLGGIPQASIQVPVGRDTQTGQAAPIHAAYSQLRVQMPAKVYLKVTALGHEGDLPNNLWEGEQLIFDGYMTGVGWQRAQNSARVTIYLLHWLSDLHYSSAISAMSHPGNPANFTYPACNQHPPLPGAGTAGGQPQWVPCASGDRMVHAGDIFTDMWGKVLKPWMLALCNEDPIDPRLRSLNTEGNAAGTRALDRMFGKNMGMDANLEDADAVAYGVQNALGDETWQTWVNTTLWGKLIGDWAPAYWFTVVPRVNDCLVVPRAGGTRETFKRVEAGEYSSLTPTCQLRQVLGNVGICYPTSMRAGAERSLGENTADLSGLAAVWPPNPENDGLKLIKEAPKWLVEPLRKFEYSPHAAGAHDEPVGNAFEAPDAAADRIPVEDPVKAQAAVVAVLERFAHQWYVNEALKSRFGELAGALRFDIAPGSALEIEGARELGLPDDTLGAKIYATVLAVTTIIDAEMQKCGTTFSLENIRNEAENQDQRYSVARPPLYNESWLGAPLAGPEAAAEAAADQEQAAEEAAEQVAAADQAAAQEV